MPYTTHGRCLVTVVPEDPLSVQGALCHTSGMAVRSRIRALAAGTTVVAVVGVGCGSAREPAAPSADVRAPRDLLLPRAAPAGLHVADVRMRAAIGTDRVVVYTAPGHALDGRMLAALYRPGDETDSLPHGGRPIDAGHDRAECGTAGAGGWIAWPVQESDHQELSYYGVIGRGLSRDELRTAAENLDESGADVRIGADAVPHDLRPLASAELLLDTSWTPSLPGGTTVTWSDRSRGAELTLTLMRSDTPSAALAGLPVAAARSVSERGRRLMSGESLFRDPLYGRAAVRVWREGGLLAAVSATGLRAQDVDATVAGLRRAGPADLRRLRAGIRRYPPADLLEPGMRMVAGGVADGAPWALGATRDDTRMQVHLRSLPRTSSGYVDTDVDDRPPRSGVETLGGVSSTRRTYTIGRARRDAARVRLRRPNAPGVSVRLGPPSVPHGSRWFLLVTDPGPRTGELIATGADGRAVGRTRFS